MEMNQLDLIPKTERELQKENERLDMRQFAEVMIDLGRRMEEHEWHHGGGLRSVLYIRLWAMIRTVQNLAEEV